MTDGSPTEYDWDMWNSDATDDWRRASSDHEIEQSELRSFLNDWEIRG